MQSLASTVRPHRGIYCNYQLSNKNPPPRICSPRELLSISRFGENILSSDYFLGCVILLALSINEIQTEKGKLGMTLNTDVI